MTVTELRERVMTLLIAGPKTTAMVRKYADTSYGVAEAALRWHEERGRVSSHGGSWRPTKEGRAWHKAHIVEPVRREPFDEIDIQAVVQRLAERDMLDAVQAICKTHGETLEAVLGRPKTANVNAARRKVYVLIREWPGRCYSLLEIARILGRKDWTTISSGIRRETGMQAA